MVDDWTKDEDFVSVFLYYHAEFFHHVFQTGSFQVIEKIGRVLFSLKIYIVLKNTSWFQAELLRR